VNKRKSQATGGEKSRPVPDIQQTPETPTKHDVPLPATRMRSTTLPIQAAGAADRARQMTQIQQTVGNVRAGENIPATVQTRPMIRAPRSADEREAAQIADTRASSAPAEAETVSVEAPGPAEERRPVERPSAAPAPVQQQPVTDAAPNRLVAATTTVQRQPAQTTSATAPAPVHVPQSLLDEVVSASIAATLRSFQQIPVTVTEHIPLPAGQVGPPTPMTKTVHVSAGYFINKSAARKHYAGHRRAAHFGAIIRELRHRGAVSTILGSSGGQLHAGRTVQVGKGTPEDIKFFIEEAVRQGTIRRFAIGAGTINRGQHLVDLPEGQLQALIQRWIYHVGVGVDCSGFVLQAAIRAREAERLVIAAYNALGSLSGMAPQPLPPEHSHQIRSASSYRRGPRVRHPSDLRPGDAWVVSGGGHIRIVLAVREVSPPTGPQAIEFDTAESSGRSTRPHPGPTGQTWRTRSRSTFDPIRRVRGQGGATRGSFHRIP
jgi:hypothetical protein